MPELRAANSDLTRVRQTALDYAVHTAEMGECPTRILARAELYADFILSDFSDRRSDVRVHAA